MLQSPLCLYKIKYTSEFMYWSDFMDKVRNLRDFTKKVMDILNSNKNDFIELESFFRGVSSNIPANENVPKVYRDYIEYEDVIINDTIANRFEYFSNCKTAIEKLEMLQHYGILTRLLDITKNQLVALYFACQKSCKENDEDGKVIIYMLERENIKYNDSETVSVLANLAFMPKNFRIEFDDKVRQPKKDENYNKLLYQIQKEKPNFLDKLDKKLFDNYIVCVVPNMNNKRIIAQQGAFLLYGMNEGIKREHATFLGKTNKHIWVEEIDIDKKYKKAILEELKFMGISYEVLFPELESYSKLIEDKYKRTQDELIEIADKKLDLINKYHNDVYVAKCPECGKKYFAYYFDENPKCIYCDYKSNIYEFAERYIEDVLGVSKYVCVKNGEEFPLYRCPECGDETFVFDNIDDEVICFTCSYHDKLSKFQLCNECNKPVLKAEGILCDDCLKYKIERDK